MGTGLRINRISDYAIEISAMVHRMLNTGLGILILIRLLGYAIKNIRVGCPYSDACIFQRPVTVLPDSLYTFIKYNSVWRRQLNWDSTDRAFRTSLLAAASTDDPLRTGVQVLRGLNDVHSQLYFNNRYFGHYPDMADTLFQR